MPRKQQVWIVAVKQNVDSCQQPEKQNRRSHLVDEYDGNLFLNQDEICRTPKRAQIRQWSVE